MSTINVLVLAIIVVATTTVSAQNCKLLGSCTQSAQTPLSQDDINAILQRHNELRSTIATGQQEGFPTASNMLELKWDNQLARKAQCWANRCVFQHDPSRNLPNGRTVGQNLAFVGNTQQSSVTSSQTLTSMVQDWYNEVKDYNPNDINQYKFSKNTGHFTQVVWANTAAVGCGHVYNKQGNMYERTLVCDYSPTGNYNSQPVYKQGSPASNCPNGISNNYKGLCN